MNFIVFMPKFNTKQFLNPLNLHCIAVLLTICISRILLWAVWNNIWMTGMKEDGWHHAYTGILLVVAAWIILRKYPKSKAVVSGIGLGLLIDEVTVPLCLIGHPVDYWSVWSWGVAVVLGVGYVGWRLRKAF